MPSLQKALGKLTDPLRTPAIYDLGSMLAPPEVFIGATPMSRPPAIYSSTVRSSDFGCQISPDWLPFLLAEAQPEIARSTYTVAAFPLAEARFFEIIPLPNAPEISENLTWIVTSPDEVSVSENLLTRLPAVDPAVSNNLFQRLQPPVVSWHNYQEKKWHTERLSDIELEEPTDQHWRAKRVVNDVEVEVSTKPQVKKPTFWDMIYPFLQPALILGNIENLFLPHDLYSYQPAGIEFLMSNKSALLADEMGTGKTIMTTVALKIMFQKNRVKRALIVCPLSVLRQWNEELSKWAPEFVTALVRGSRAIRDQTWKTNAHVYVTTYDSLRVDVENEILPPRKLGMFDVVVLDEAQNIKNPTSGRSKSIKKLNVRQRWALTGTPIENKIEDLASLFEFLNPGFLSPFDLYPERIKEKIKPYFLRRLKKDVLRDLPPKINQDLWLELDDLQRAEYERVISEIRGQLTALGARVTKIHIFSSIQRLKQICNFAPGSLTSSKTETLKEQVEQIVQCGQKVIIFSQYLKEGIEKLEQVLDSYGLAKLVGEQSGLVREREIERFKKSSDTPILLASVKTGGVGLNLTVASYVVHFDHWWNPATMWQAEGRVHRIGQKATKVNVYSYWIRDTIEEKIYNTLREKGLLFENVIDGLSESQIEELISTDDWLEMLGVKVKDKVTLPTKSDELAHLSLEEIRQRLLDLSPSKFEHVAKELIRCLGYPNPKVTGKSGDGGIDILASRNTEDGVVRVAAQCKRYKGTVSEGTARDFRGALTKDASITKGFLVTTGEFSRQCKWFCEQSGIIVPISGVEIARYMKDFGIALE